MQYKAHIVAIFLATALSGCDIDQTQEGELPKVDVGVTEGQVPKFEIKQTQEGKLPKVDVDVKGGKMPAYDIDTVDIDVGTKEVDVKVPDVDVTMKKKTLTVPNVDLEMPDPDSIDDNE